MSEKIFTKDLVKGDWVKLASGFEAKIQDNQRRRNIRMCEVFGYVDEWGSVYAWDIVLVLKDGEWSKVTHTNEQARAQSRLFGLR